MSYTDEELIEQLTELGKELGRVPRSSDMNEADGRPSTGAYQNHFGSWGEALEAAGFDTSDRNTTYSREELLDHLIEMEDKLERPPNAEDLDETDDRPCSVTYVRRFGDLNSALEAAGIQPDPSESS